ncbi:hypothetical protein V1515DRAFT_585484 [Lipomyces mesembrius]
MAKNLIENVAIVGPNHSARLGVASASFRRGIAEDRKATITMSVMTPPDQQTKLIDAAAAANVTWILPNEFGDDPLNVEMGRDNFLGVAKTEYRDHIEKLGKSSWIAIACGFWYEFSLGGEPSRYGFDFKHRTVTLFDDGNIKIYTVKLCRLQY